MNSVLIDNTVSERPTQREDDLRQVLSSIRELLSEFADCEADAGCRIPDAPVGEQSQGIAGMLFRLRHDLTNDDMLCEARELRDQDREFAGRIRQLREKRSVLLDMLDDLVELAISSSRVSSWSDIEVRFLRFSISLSEHLADQNGMVKRQPEQRAPKARVF